MGAPSVLREQVVDFAAIVVADMVGYSRLMGNDETGTLAELKTLRRELIDPKISAYEGRIAKTTGDEFRWNSPVLSTRSSA